MREASNVPRGARRGRDFQAEMRRMVRSPMHAELNGHMHFESELLEGAHTWSPVSNRLRQMINFCFGAQHSTIDVLRHFSFSVSADDHAGVVEAADGVSAQTRRGA
jgi:hypothetical protein